MNDFIELIKIYLKSDSTLINDNLENFIYTQLISFNLGNNQQPLVDQNHLFNEWISRNNYQSNIKTFVSSKHPYFCQFVNPNATNIVKDAIKLYVPLDEKHLFNGVNMLTDFLVQNNIQHNSKICKRIRNDNVVLRVSNIEEAKKVIEFVGNNSYIQEGLLNVNPFTNKINGVGIAKDGYYSYNSKLCSALADFVVLLNDNNRLDDLNLNSFRMFLEDYKLNCDYDSKLIYNQILNVINKGYCNIENYENVIDGNILELNNEKMFNEIIKQTYIKYGMKHTIFALSKFKNNGDFSSFTGSNNRNFIKNNITVDNFNTYCLKHGISHNAIKDYIELVVGLEFNYIVNAYLETYKKYGKVHADHAIKRFIYNKEYNYITNDNEARNNLKQVDYNNVVNIIFEGLNLSSVSSIDELICIFIEYNNNSNKKNL